VRTLEKYTITTEWRGRRRGKKKLTANLRNSRTSRKWYKKLDLKLHRHTNATTSTLFLSCYDVSARFIKPPTLLPFFSFPPRFTNLHNLGKTSPLVINTTRVNHSHNRNPHNPRPAPNHLRKIRERHVVIFSSHVSIPLELASRSNTHPTAAAALYRRD
jgi:hypothetical protein